MSDRHSCNVTGKRAASRVATRAAREDLWGDYWVGAALNGCTEQFPVDVQTAIIAGWRQRFLAIGNANSVLDVGCGRGALLALARDAGLPARGATMVGVDLAPAAALAGEGFDLRGDIDAASLPFPDRAFATVVSQFGVEYAGVERALHETARVAGSTVALLMHAAEGIVAQHATEQRAQVSALNDHLALRTRLRAAIDAGTAGAFAAVLADIAGRAESAANHSLLEQLYATISELHRLATVWPRREQLYGAVDDLVAQLEKHAERMGALARAAPTRAQVDRSAAQLRMAGFAVRVSEERSRRGDLVGYWLDASRGDQS